MLLTVLTSSCRKLMEIRQTRWLRYEQAATSISMPMLIILVFWRAALFARFGLHAPSNGTVVTSLLISTLSVSSAEPGTMLRHVHDFVRDRLATDGFFFTMAAVRFSIRGRRANFAAAGHPPAMLLSNGVVRLLDSQNGILGCLSEIAPSESANEIELTSGDRFILYTDGLIEVFNTQEEMLGIEGFSQLVLDAASLTPPKMRQAIIDGVAAWSHGPLADDVSLVIAEIR